MASPAGAGAQHSLCSEVAPPLRVYLGNGNEGVHKSAPQPAETGDRAAASRPSRPSLPSGSHTERVITGFLIT